jgi:hypothetical protein
VDSLATFASLPPAGLGSLEASLDWNGRSCSLPAWFKTTSHPLPAQRWAEKKGGVERLMAPGQHHVSHATSSASLLPAGSGLLASPWRQRLEPVGRG